MPERPSLARWQSIVETFAIVAVAGAVVWSTAGRPAVTTGSVGTVQPPPRPTPPPMPIEPMSLEGAELLGSRTALIGMALYSDFECPFCARFARETLPALDAQYVKTGKLLLAFRQFPLPIHGLAMKAAEAAECAGRQGKFWPYHDRLFLAPQTLDPVRLTEHARRTGLEPTRFAACLDGQAAADVTSDKTGGTPLGVVGTPTFLAGPILPDGRVSVSQRFSGALPLAEFQAILDRLLAAVPVTGARPGQNE